MNLQRLNKLIAELENKDVELCRYYKNKRAVLIDEINRKINEEISKL